MSDDLVFDDQALADLLSSPNGGVAKDLMRRATNVRGLAVRSLHQPGRGRVYKKTNPRRTHQASAPGEPAATDLGQLAGSIDQAIGQDGQGLYAIVGSSLKVAAWLELGTRRIAPRPTLRQALQQGVNKRGGSFGSRS